MPATKPTTPTEAQKELGTKVRYALPGIGDQLIAESEARASALLIHELEKADQLRAEVQQERDQLRAEVEQAHVTRDATCIKLAGELREARAEVERLKQVVRWHENNIDACRSDAGSDSAKVNAAMTRAEKAEAAQLDAVANADLAMFRMSRIEAELATERARLDWLMAGGVCMVQHTGGFHVSRLHAPVSRAAIDAAMKEEAK